MTDYWHICKGLGKKGLPAWRPDSSNATRYGIVARIMEKALQVIVFSLGEALFAVPAEYVTHVHAATEVRTLQEAPDTVPGLVDIHGVVMPVVDMRRKCGLDPVPLSPRDFFIELSVSGRPFVLRVDSVLDVAELPEDGFADPKVLVPGIAYAERVARYGGRLAVMYDIVSFFKPEYSLEVPRG